MLDGLDSRTHLATLVSPILPTCFRPYEKTQQLSGVFNTEICPFGEVSLKPLNNVIFHPIRQLTEGNYDTFRGLELKSS